MKRENSLTSIYSSWLECNRGVMFMRTKVELLYISNASTPESYARVRFNFWNA